MSSQISPWFERRFAFDFPPTVLPNLLARLRGTPARLEELLRGQPPAMLMAKPEGKWSAQEQAGHMLQLEPMWLARVRDYATGGERLTPTDLANAATDQADYNRQSLGDILAGFRCARGALVEAGAGIDPETAERVLPHPRLGAGFRLVDHLYFVAEHDDHHLARIWELLHAAVEG